MAVRSFSKYVRKAEKKLAQLEKKQGLRPVIIEGGVIARTWWGTAWNKNLESYAEYTNRIGGGRSDVRSGAVLDLQVGAGEVKALVQGSRAKPYAITITIKKLNKNTWNLVASACKGKLESLEELLAGKFPTVLEETFMQRKTGLFPSPREIEFACTCPDWASMCRHIAATLYGIGARLDEDPMLFFTLRGVDAGDLISHAAGVISSKAEDLLQKDSKRSTRKIEGTDLSAAFGVARAENAGPSSSDDAAAAKIPDEESARMADVRKILKKQLKMDAKLAKKEKLSKKSNAKKKVVKQNANGIVEKVVNKQFRFGIKK
ncbi:MAG: hypothetical protein M0R70_16040 [Nitrospirae bacterium]|nr:hypothetical protein [Nitrospirota bacterium]